MATLKINEHCYYVENDPHKCKIKLEKFYFDILCRFGVIKESLPGDRKVKKLAYLPGYWLDLAKIWCRGVFLDSKSKISKKFFIRRHSDVKMT